MSGGRSPRPRRGWGALAGLAMVAMFGWIGPDPGALLAIPFALVVIALPPRKPWMVALAALAVFFAVRGLPRESIWLLDRGWALVLGGWFVLALLLLPRAAFVAQALAAIAAAAANAAALFALQRGGLAGVDLVVRAHLRATYSTLGALWAQLVPSAAHDIIQAADRAASFSALVAPASVALASLAALGAARGVHRALVEPTRPPFAPLREFRFRDELVWVLIVGVVLLVVPGLGHGAPRAGSNMVLFMGALYALRGLAVMAFLGSAGLGMGSVLFLVLALAFAAPLLVGATVVVGLTDTWLDLRARVTASGSPGK